MSNSSDKIKIVDHQSAKILATIGPASSSHEMLLGLAKAGVNCFRLNFSHGEHKDHKEVIDRITAINIEHGLTLGILADLQGPKLRIGDLEEKYIDLAAGDVLTFVQEPCIGTREKIYMNYDLFATDVEVGERVMIDDGKLVFEVIETNKKDQVKLKTLFGGKLSSRKGVNLPDTKLTLPALTEKDERDLEYMLQQPEINWIALSFVRKAIDVKDLIKRIRLAGHDARVMAKIEKPEALNDLDEIIKVSDGVMIARGDLGVEVPMERLPIVQKDIIRRCLVYSKPVVVATQMMESMVTNPSPTRAEITDVANAIFDNADCLMLSGETSVGIHPIKVVQAMNTIIAEAESQYDMRSQRPKPDQNSRTFLSDMLCLNAAKTAEELSAKGIVGMTSSGYTAYRISSYRRKPPIHIFSDKKHTLCTLNLVWGVRCHYYDKFTSTDETIIDVAHTLKEKKVVVEDDIIVHVGSMPLYKRYRANMMKITVID